MTDNQKLAIIVAAEAMFDAWNCSEFDSDHHTITGVLVAVADARHNPPPKKPDVADVGETPR